MIFFVVFQFFFVHNWELSTLSTAVQTFMIHPQIEPRNFWKEIICAETMMFMYLKPKKYIPGVWTVLN